MTGCVISHWLHKDREVTYVGLVIFTVLKKSTVDKEMVNHILLIMYHVICPANPIPNRYLCQSLNISSLTLYC